MPSLTRLELAYCPRLSGACLSLLERLPRLQRLDLNRIDDVAGEHLRALEACTALRTIKVGLALPLCIICPGSQLTHSPAARILSSLLG